jgi:hypothetical protein
LKKGGGGEKNPNSKKILYKFLKILGKKMKNQKPFFAPPPFSKVRTKNQVFSGSGIFKTSLTHTQISIFCKK